MNAARLFAIVTVLGLLTAITTGCAEQKTPGKGTAPAAGSQAGNMAPGSAAGLGKSATATTPASQDDPAIKEAKDKDHGDDLPAGGIRRIDTSNGAVEISKDSSGRIEYKKL